MEEANQIFSVCIDCYNTYMLFTRIQPNGKICEVMFGKI